MDIYWMMAALFGVGAISGATIRLPIFVIVLLAAAVVAGLSQSSQGIGWAALFAVIAVVVLQLGYGCGILLRSAMRAVRQGQGEAAAAPQDTRIRLPSEPRQR